MNRPVPLWFFLLCILSGALFTVAFSWAVKSTVYGSNRSGLLGEAAVEISSFPSVTKEVVMELLDYVSGDYKDEAIRVQREEFVVDYSGFEPFPKAIPMEIPGLLVRADQTRMAQGWRVLVGAFQINGNIENAVLLISPHLEIARTWILDETPVGGREPQPKHRKFVHGVGVLRDGSVIFTFDGSISLRKFNACGLREWTTPGPFHHAVTLDDTGETVWTLKNEDTTT